jgi:hypothetical protein
MPEIGTNEGTGSAHRGSSYSRLPNKVVRAANGIDYAYRDTGQRGGGDAPLVLLQHFRGLGPRANRRPGIGQARDHVRHRVGGSTVATPDTVVQMARDAIAFIAALWSSRRLICWGSP